MFKYVKVGRGSVSEPGDELCAGDSLFSDQEIQ
jgi:hypothetical protein